MSQGVSQEILPLDYLSYGSTPSRLVSKIEEIMEHTANRGKACVHPFNAFPYLYYEGGILGRQKSMVACCRLIDICGEFAIYGISEGTLIELQYVLDKNTNKDFQRPVEIFVKEFDPEWEKYYEQYYKRFSTALDYLKFK
jgi:hypothetical protein